MCVRVYIYTLGDALNHAPQCIQPAEPLLPGFPVLSRTRWPSQCRKSTAMRCGATPSTVRVAGGHARPWATPSTMHPNAFSRQSLYCLASQCCLALAFSMPQVNGHEAWCKSINCSRCR